MRRTVAGIAVGALIAAVPTASAAPFTGTPTSSLVVDSYRLRVTAPTFPPDVWHVAPNRVRLQTLAPGRSIFVGRDGLETVGRTRDSPGSVHRNVFPGEPDALPSGPNAYADAIAYALAESRAGVPTFTPVNLGGQAALRADVTYPANRCAGQSARRIRIWLSAQTLLPLRVVERLPSGRIAHSEIMTYGLVNRSMPTGTFRPPPVAAGASRRNSRFTRTTPAVAAGFLPYRPQLPAALPSGYSLAVSGWAPRGSVLGPEGSIPADASVFVVEYRRGQERITITQRASTSPWPVDDPFGFECATLRTETVTIGAHSGSFGIGPNVRPHVIWWDGAVRHTVSGPFPKDDLVAIAASLTPVSG